MNPGRRHHRAHTLRDHRDILLRDPELASNVAHEFVHVLNKRRHRCRRALFALRAAVRARVPCEEGDLGKIQFVDDMRHAARVLVPAMESIGTRSSWSALMTPMCAPPRAPPPDSTSPIDGRAF